MIGKKTRTKSRCCSFFLPKPCGHTMGFPNGHGQASGVVDSVETLDHWPDELHVVSLDVTG